MLSSLPSTSAASDQASAFPAVTGAERILGRWSAYARDGHGGNIELRALVQDDADLARHFVFSLLRVFGPDTPVAEVDAVEAHFKRALLSREFGLNRN